MTPPTALEQALQHEASLRRLAVALCQDPASADDAVQQALTQEALGKRPPGAPLLAWLKTVVRNHAANLHKLAARRQRHERLAGGTRVGSQPAPDELVGREQLRRRVADAVLGLAEPYRTTVWLRWFEGLDVAAIAARDGAPVPTVRTRLQRAHAQLRERLDRDYGDRRWVGLVLPAGTAAAGGAAVGWLIGGVVVKKWVAAAVVLVAALGVGAAMLPSLLEDVPPPIEVVRVDAPAEPPASMPPPAAEDRPRASVAAAPAPAVRPTLRFVWPDRRPAAGLPVWFWGERDLPQWTKRVRTEAIDIEEDPPPVPTGLVTDARGEVPIPTEPAPFRWAVGPAPNLWVAAAIPVDCVVTLPILHRCEARLVDGRRDMAWTAEFVAVDQRRRPGETTAGALCVRVPSIGVCRIDPLRVSGTGDEPIVPHSFEDQAYLVTAELPGFEVVPIDRGRAPRAHGGPFRAYFRVERPLPTLRVTVLDPRGGPTTQAGTVRLAAGERGHFVRPLVAGVGTFDTVDQGLEPRVRVRMDDGEEFTLEPKFKASEFDRRVECVLGTGRKPTVLRLPELGRERLRRVFVACDGGEWTVVRQTGSLAAVPDAIGYGIVDDRIWVQGQPSSCTELGIAVVTEQLHVAVASMPAGADVQGAWDAANVRKTIDVAEVYERFGRLPRIGVEVQFGLPSPREGLQWVTLYQHRRDPALADPSPPPIWPDVVLPWEVPWRLRVTGDHGVLADLRQVR